MTRAILFFACLVAVAITVAADPCSKYRSSCQTCTAGKSSDATTCNWCSYTSECVSRSTSCTTWSPKITSQALCPRAPTAPAKAPVYRPAPVYSPYRAPVYTPSSCTAYSCASCVVQANCGWCHSLNRCVSGSYSGAFYSYQCPRGYSDWDWATCRNKTRSRGVVIGIVLGGFAIGIFVAMIIGILARRHRQRASEDITTFELSSTEPFTDNDQSPSYISQPSFGNALPGYLYTTQSSDANTPQYVYTAVPVGPVVDSIPQ